MQPRDPWPLWKSGEKEEVLLAGGQKPCEGHSNTRKVLWTDETKTELSGLVVENSAHQCEHSFPRQHGAGGSIVMGCTSSAGTGKMLRVDGKVQDHQGLETGDKRLGRRCPFQLAH